MSTLIKKAAGPQYSLTTVNVITAGIMVLFHILAVIALFYFSWTNLLVALALHWAAVGFGILIVSRPVGALLRDGVIRCDQAVTGRGERGRRGRLAGQERGDGFGADCALRMRR